MSVTISGLSTREITANRFRTLNNTAGYKATVMTESLNLVIRGTSSAIADVESADIVIVADLSSLRNATGTFTVPAIIEVDKSGVDAVGNYTVTVTIEQN